MEGLDRVEERDSDESDDGIQDVYRIREFASIIDDTQVTQEEDVDCRVSRWRIVYVI